jgi:N-acetylglucosamine-6-phosphate deacetylase
VNTLWIADGKLIAPRGIADGAVKIEGGRIAAIRRRPPRRARTLSARGSYVAPGFIDLHVWGEPATLARALPRGGTTAFLAALGPAPARQLEAQVAGRARALNVKRLTLNGAECLGWHLEGPFLNPARGGALPARWMRRPSVRELRRLSRAAGGRLRMVTLAPELPGAEEAIRWCRRRRVVVSLGHSQAGAGEALEAVEQGAAAATHVFNGMPPFHHRAPSLLDVALTDPRLTAMVIADGIHLSAQALRLLLRAKGPRGVALVTDSVEHQRRAWALRRQRGAFYAPDGTLAGSGLTMMRAVRNAVALGGATLPEAVRMASAVPARLLGDRRRGRLQPGARADLVVFDRQFNVLMTFVGGDASYEGRTGR